MKKIYLFLFSLPLLFTACYVPGFVFYLGDGYAPTNEVAVYYAEKDVPYDYTVIGYLKRTVDEVSFVENCKQEMISIARQKGGNALLFEYFQSGLADDCEDDGEFTLMAQVLKYKDQKLN